MKRGRILPAKKPEVSKAVAMMRERVQDHYGPDVDPLPLAASGLTQRAWRNAEAEGVHGGGTDRRISDGEMLAANVATTRLVLQNLRSFPAVDWDALGRTLCCGLTLIAPSAPTGGEVRDGRDGWRHLLMA